ncbi:MAG: glucose-1-phosphate adenylyltransferase [Anaerolineaceae bacterium]|nr:glucose-1-phosphate adenylyltransferase [Anaerolineaceae bacterium]
MKTRVVILAGGEGTRLGVLTAKRTKPAVPFGGKYRIIDFTLSNCINSNLFDVMIIAQYRPHSRLEHIGAGTPGDLNREIAGGVQVYTPFQASAAGWFKGTADAVQQNFTFIKSGEPDFILILSGDHIYSMDYSKMIKFHTERKADLTIAALEVPASDASRFGIVGVDEQQKVTSFIEKPEDPPSNLANMGVYLFNREILDDILWKDHLQQASNHDFGKDIIPKLVQNNFNIYAYPFRNYWVDVGTVYSFWNAHMDLLLPSPPLDLYNLKWMIHTREEKRPPTKINRKTIIDDSLICDGCIIEEGARISRSVLSPGVRVGPYAEIHESILLTDGIVGQETTIIRAILDKKVLVGEGACIGEELKNEFSFAMVGKNSHVPPNYVVKAGSIISTDVIVSDYPNTIIQSGERIQTRRLPHEI